MRMVLSFNTAPQQTCVFKSITVAKKGMTLRVGVLIPVEETIEQKRDIARKGIVGKEDILNW